MSLFLILLVLGTPLLALAGYVIGTALVFPVVALLHLARGAANLLRTRAAAR